MSNMKLTINRDNDFQLLGMYNSYFRRESENMMKYHIHWTERWSLYTA